eukprot:4640483-Prymnesium_polylepis.1
MAGRVCPLSYRFGAARLREMPRLQCETLFAVGGLYGNTLALRAVQQRAALEERPCDTHVVFNGDFNFFNVSPSWWLEVNGMIRDGARLHATLGNVEVEATRPGLSDAGCGCAYPDYVSDGVVERSNAIVGRCGGRPPLLLLLLLLPLLLLLLLRARRCGVPPL